MYGACVKQNAEIMMCNSKLLFKDGTERFNSYTEIFDTFDDKEDYLALSRSSLCYLLVKKSLFDNITIPDLRNGEDMAVIPLLMFLSFLKYQILLVDDLLHNFFLQKLIVNSQLLLETILFH